MSSVTVTVASFANPAMPSRKQPWVRLAAVTALAAIAILTGSTPESSAQIARLVDEYRAWADRMRGAGVLVRGEKLEVGGVFLRPSGDGFDRRSWSRGPGFVGGYFVIRARSYDEVVEIAGTCPHLRHGGTIEIRRLEET